MNLRTLAVLVPLVLVVAACSAPATAPSATPQSSDGVAPAKVEVTMTDAMRFEPAILTVRRGEAVTFIVKNAGLIIHEFFVGPEAAQVDHAMEMAMPGMTSHGHHNGLSVKPGETGELTMTFAEAGTQLVGCHEPGHYKAGMSGVISIVD